MLSELQTMISSLLISLYTHTHLQSFALSGVLLSILYSTALVFHDLPFHFFFFTNKYKVSIARDAFIKREKLQIKSYDT